MDAKTPAAATTRHELFITDGNASFRWAITDSGVTLSADGLSWTIDSNEAERNYSDISSIRLHRASAGTSAGVGVCQIRFRDGATLVVYGGTAQGLADDPQAARFAAFTRDLHKRLAARKDTSHIYYHAGLSEGRNMVLTIAIVASAILFGLLPLGLLIMMRDLHTLILFGTATGLLWGFYQLWDKNRPRPYTPTSVPEELLS
jgi:hypothetical protein